MHSIGFHGYSAESFWIGEIKSLQDGVYTLMEFSKELDKYQLFWDMIDELDHKTHVLEPEAPTRASNTRRIFIGTKLSYTEICWLEHLDNKDTCISYTLSYCPKCSLLS